MSPFPPPAPLQAPQPFLPRLPEPMRTAAPTAPGAVMDPDVMDPSPEAQTAPQTTPSPGEVPALGAGIVGSIIGRAGLVAVALYIAQQYKHAKEFVVDAQLPKTTTALDQASAIKPVAYVFALLAIAMTGWWVHGVDVSADRFSKFHKAGSWLAPLTPLALLPLFVLNGHFMTTPNDPTPGLDLRPAAVLLVAAVVLWLPISRTRAAVASIGTKLPFWCQFVIDLLAVGTCLSALRTTVNPTAASESASMDRVVTWMTAAAIFGAIGILSSAVLMMKTRHAITLEVKAAARPQTGEVTPFVVQTSSVLGAPSPHRSMIPLAPFRWALLASFGIWILSHFVVAVLYLRLGDLIDRHATKAEISHQITTSVVAGLIGFAAVFIAQWAWVIVVVFNANRATMLAPSRVVACLLAAAPLGVLAASAFVEGPARIDLLVIGGMAGILSFFLSFSMASRAVASIGGDMMSIRQWSLAISLWMAIQYFSNVLRPPTAQQVLILAIATAIVRAGALIVAVRAAARVTTAVDASLYAFRQVKRVE